MKELIEKYFRGEMTEAEEEALGAQLLNSDETARQFGNRAEAAYKGFGLPEPKWLGRGPVPAPFAGPKLGPWIGPFFLVLIFGALLWYFLRPGATGNIPVVAVKVETREAEVLVPVHSSTPREPVETMAKKVSRALPPPIVTTLPAGLSRESTASSAKSEDPGAPPSIGEGQKEAFPELQVILNLKAPGTVRVRVLDASKVEVRRLFEGQMQPGRWSFEWDGFMENGSAAQPGQYHIEVESEGVTKDRTLLIH